MGDLTEHFSRKDFACKCGCGFDAIDKRLVEMLEEIRNIFGRTIKVVSGCRCPAHNKAIGSKDDSPHPKGLAVDLECIASRDRYELLFLVMSRFYRVGIGKTFIHADIDSSRDQEVCWLKI